MRGRVLIATVLAGGAIGLASGCSVKEDEPDLVAGKRHFVEKCGACHQLARAETRGTQGPNLDEAFQQALKDGMKRNGVEGAVLEQIKNPARLSKDNPVYMPPNLVTGRDAENVAAYVAEATAKRGKDEGLLATAVPKPGGGKPVAAEAGVLTIDATAQLAYEASAATAEAGQLEIRSPNPSGTPHNIALEGGGIDEKGEVVTNNGVSSISVDVKKGKYTFYCSVPGHREGGMEGQLTVE